MTQKSIASLNERQAAWLISRVEIKRKRLISEVEMEKTQSWEDVEESFYRDEQLSTSSSSSSYSVISSCKHDVSTNKMREESAELKASGIPSRKGNVYISLVPISTGLMY